MTQAFDDWEREYHAQIAHGIAALAEPFAVTGYHGHETRNGVSWIATLRYGRRIVAHVEDAGNGGGPRIDWTYPALRGRFEAEAGRLFPDDFLAVETLVETLLRKAGK